MRARVERGQTVVRAVLLVAAVLVIGVLLYRQLSRFTTERVPVWVSAADLKAGQVVTGGVMKRVEMPAPKGAFVDPAAVQGRTLKVAKPAGQPFYPADLEPRPVPPALASTIPAGRLLATVRVAAFDLPTDDLRGGDRLDIIKSGSGGTEMVAHDAYMMGNLRSTPAQGESNRLLGIDLTPPDQKKANAAAEALVLAVFPEDVFPLAAAAASGEESAAGVRNSTPDCRSVSDGDRPKIRRHAMVTCPGSSVVAVRMRLASSSDGWTTNGLFSIRSACGAAVETGRRSQLGAIRGRSNGSSTPSGIDLRTCT